ncbi:hypothetical protein P4C99_17525 [Pontiellaceae bacterium B1224]|nr:hypothetical protein [Pontiellaceae bacterium B1224]
MTNINKSKCRKAATLLFPMVGIGMLLGTESFSQTKTSSGTNDAQVVTAVSKRDPFWPVGYVPKELQKNSAKEVKKPTESNDWNGAMKKVVINGVSSRADNEFFAVVNGEVKSVNDTISVTHDGMTYTWAVASIKPPGSVKLRRVSAL